MTAEDLVVLEDGVEQTIDAFHESLNPVSIVLALDRSGSMKNSADLAKAAASSFVAALRPQDALGVMMFADRTELVVDLGTGRDKAQARNRLVPSRGRDCSVRCHWGIAGPAQEGRRPSCDRRRDRRAG